MKINSEKLWDYIFNLATDEKVRFEVYCDDFYSTEILWNGEEFEWESGTFTSKAFFNPMYDFIPIEEEKEKEIEKIIICKAEHGYLANKINELIDEIKKLKELNK